MRNQNGRKNEYMDMLWEKLFDYEDACKEYEALKDSKREELSNDEFWAWYAWYKENNKPKHPLTGGQGKALRLWIWAETEELVFDDFVWEREAHDFIDTLRKAGIKTFVVTNQSTSLMENMHWFQQEGCKLVGLCEVEPTDEWERKFNGTKMGVRFAL